MTVAQLISHLRECDQAAIVETQAIVRVVIGAEPITRGIPGQVFALTTGFRDGAERVILNSNPL